MCEQQDRPRKLQRSTPASDWMANHGNERKINGWMKKKKGLTFLLIFISSPLEMRFQFFSTVFIIPDTYIPEVMKTGSANLNFLCNFHNFPCLILVCSRCCSRLISGFFACFLIRDLCGCSAWNRGSDGKIKNFDDLGTLRLLQTFVGVLQKKKSHSRGF